MIYLFISIFIILAALIVARQVALSKKDYKNTRKQYQHKNPENKDNCEG